jgi:hypothetical protein
MLSEYIAYRIQELHERAYNRLVLVLASSSSVGVLLSGLALFVSPSLKYLAIAVFIFGIMLAARIHRKTLEKMQRIIKSPEAEIVARSYFAMLKELYTEGHLIRRMLTEPQIEDPIIKREKKAVIAATRFFEARYAALKMRSKIVIVATSISMMLPHLVVLRDMVTAVIMISILIIVRKILKNSGC